MKSKLTVLFSLLLFGCNRVPNESNINELPDELTSKLTQSFNKVQIVNEDFNGIRTYHVENWKLDTTQYIIQCQYMVSDVYKCSPPVRVK